MSNFEDVGRFHRKFELRNNYDNGNHPVPEDDDLLEYRHKFMEEELIEFKEGMDEGDHAKMFDALIDLVYVAMGTAHLQGYPWEDGWDLVQNANMKKARALPDGSDSKRKSKWDVVKPEGWKPPNIEALLETYGWEFGNRCPQCKVLYSDESGCEYSKNRGGYYCEKENHLYITERQQ